MFNYKVSKRQDRSYLVNPQQQLNSPQNQVAIYRNNSGTFSVQNLQTSVGNSQVTYSVQNLRPNTILENGQTNFSIQSRPPRTFGNGQLISNSQNYYYKNNPTQNYDTKTIWGSDIVKFAVNQTNDFLALEDLLYDTGFLFICPNTEPNVTEFETVIRNENGRILFYCQEAENWSSSGWSIFECATLDFAFRIFNTNFREVLSVSGRQCCYGQGIMEIKCGCYHLGTIQQQAATAKYDGSEYSIKEPNGQILVNLKRAKDGKRISKWYVGSAPFTRKNQTLPL